MSPVGPYFPTGLQPISLFLDEQNVRAWPGGVGSNKVGTNYAPTIGPQTDAAAQYGTSQVIYSFPQGKDPDDALVSECGSMNMMFFIQKVALFVCSDTHCNLPLICWDQTTYVSSNCQHKQFTFFRTTIGCNTSYGVNVALKLMQAQLHHDGLMAILIIS